LIFASCIGRFDVWVWTCRYKILGRLEGIFLRLSTNSAYFNLSKPPSGLLRLGSNQ
jgi:hypothetical protein